MKSVHLHSQITTNVNCTYQILQTIKANNLVNCGLMTVFLFARNFISASLLVVGH
jgi:hypothetical protein